MLPLLEAKQILSYIAEKYREVCFSLHRFRGDTSRGCKDATFIGFRLSALLRVPGAVLSWLTRQSFLWFCNNCSSALTPTPSLKHSWSLTRKPSLLLRNPITKLEPSKYKDTKKTKTIIYWRMDSFGVTASEMDRVLAFLDALASLHFNLSVRDAVIYVLAEFVR